MITLDPVEFCKIVDAARAIAPPDTPEMTLRQLVVDTLRDFLPPMITEMHQHHCATCGNRWMHPNYMIEDVPSHTCGICKTIVWKAED